MEIISDGDYTANDIVGKRFVSTSPAPQHRNVSEFFKKRIQQTGRIWRVSRVVAWGMSKRLHKRLEAIHGLVADSGVWEIAVSVAVLTIILWRTSSFIQKPAKHANINPVTTAVMPTAPQLRVKFTPIQPDALVTKDTLKVRVIQETQLKALTVALQQLVHEADSSFNYSVNHSSKISLEEHFQRQYMAQTLMCAEDSLMGGVLLREGAGTVDSLAAKYAVPAIARLLAHKEQQVDWAEGAEKKQLQNQLFALQAIKVAAEQGRVRTLPRP